MHLIPNLSRVFLPFIVLIFANGLSAQLYSFQLECVNNPSAVFTLDEANPANGCPCYEGILDNEPTVIFLAAFEDYYVWFGAVGTCENIGSIKRNIAESLDHNCDILQAKPGNACSLTPIYIPALSQWGSIILVISLVIMGTIILKQRNIGWN